MNYIDIKEDLEKLGCHHIQLVKKSLFDDIRLNVPKNIKSKVISHIMVHYKGILSLRVDMDDILIYTYFKSDKNKIEKIKKDLLLHKQRFKWLYEQIKDEEVFLKNVKEN